MTNDVHPKFMERWADIYVQKHNRDGAQAARAWFSRSVPDGVKARVLVKIRKRIKA